MWSARKSFFLGWFNVGRGPKAPTPAKNHTEGYLGTPEEGNGSRVEHNVNRGSGHHQVIRERVFQPHVYSCLLCTMTAPNQSERVVLNMVGLG